MENWSLGYKTIDAAVLHFDKISAGEKRDYVKFIQEVEEFPRIVMLNAKFINFVMASYVILYPVSLVIKIKYLITIL